MDRIEYSGILFSILRLLRLFYTHVSIKFWHEAPWHSRGQRVVSAYSGHKGTDFDKKVGAFELLDSFKLRRYKRVEIV